MKRRHIHSEEKEQLLQSTTKGKAAKQIISEKGDEECHTFLPFFGQKELSPLTHRMKSRLVPNGHLGQ